MKRHALMYASPISSTPVEVEVEIKFGPPNPVTGEQPATLTALDNGETWKVSGWLVRDVILNDRHTHLSRRGAIRAAASAAPSFDLTRRS